MSTLRSMTGFGSATQETAGLRISVECRSVNGRYLKINTKLPDVLRAEEPTFEKLLKERLQRGTVTLSVRIERTDPEALVSVNEDVVRAYQAVFDRLGLSKDGIPTLPGVLGSARSELSAEQIAGVRSACTEAVDALVEMREQEGRALESHLRQLCEGIAAERHKVLERAPAVVEEYRNKLKERIDAMLEGSGAELDDATLAREVAVYASRSDVTEEVERIVSHLDQIDGLLKSGDAAGRTLDFLGQELHREVNTIGSKSSDVALGRSVIEMKALVDRFKEQAANVE